MGFPVRIGQEKRIPAQAVLKGGNHNGTDADDAFCLVGSILLVVVVVVPFRGFTKGISIRGKAAIFPYAQ